MNRRALTPSSSLPLVYFACAHAGLATALVMLAVDPGLPGGYFLHPRFAALVHLLTLAWITGSILGAFYIVAPLALGLPLPVRAGDWIACSVFVAGTAGAAVHFWTGRYGGMGWSGVMVLSAVVWLAARAARGLRSSTAPGPVLVHVMLAFANIIGAGCFGVAIGLGRAYGPFGLSPLTAAFVHLHLAAIGWPLMMVIGLAYRLVPMFLPARMPKGLALLTSAVLIEAGLVAIVVALLTAAPWLPLGALLIVGGLAAFMRQMRDTLRHRLRRPPALPRRDWSTWQTHAALVWLLIAAVLGMAIAIVPAGEHQIRLAWLYGVAGLVGFISQIVVGIQGRLVPLYAYYRAMSARGGKSPARAANDLPSASFARGIFLLWTTGVPWLAWGLATTSAVAIRLSSLVLLAGVLMGAGYGHYLMKRAQA
jgi:hypothetical protein